MVLLILWLVHSMLAPVPATPADSAIYYSENATLLESRPPLTPTLQRIEPIGPEDVEHGRRVPGLAVRGRSYRVTCRVLGSAILWAAGYEGAPAEGSERVRWVVFSQPCRADLAMGQIVTCLFPANPGRIWTVLADRPNRIEGCAAAETSAP